MSVPFSEDLWQRLSGLWRRDKKEEEEAVGYDDPQLKQIIGNGLTKLFFEYPCQIKFVDIKALGQRI